VIASTVYSLGA